MEKLYHKKTIPFVPVEPDILAYSTNEFPDECGVAYSFAAYLTKHPSFF